MPSELRKADCGSRIGRAAIPGLCALVVVWAAEAQPQAGRAAQLTGLSALKSAYDAILNAQFPRAADALQAACGPAPAEACGVLRATSLWWQILLDPRNTGLDQTFLREVNQAIADCERWTTREPERAEAWFYLGAAYGARVSWRVERGERLAAARDGKRIKEALERALSIDPSFEDARFGIGLYKYYADIAPTAAKLLRFFLLLPGGDKEEGLRDMQASEARGELVAGEALYQLHWIYFWYEQTPDKGLSALERLHARYPANPHFLQRIGEVEVEYYRDAAKSLAAWQQLTDGAAQSGAPPIAEVRGRLGTAEQLDALFETDRAVAEARKVVALSPTKPYGATARAQLLLGRLLDRLGDRARAAAAYRAATAAAPAGDPDRVRAEAQAALNRGVDPVAADAYRVSLSGWRAFERGDIAAARRDLSQAREQAPDDTMIRVRLARVTAAEDPAAALAEMDQVIALRPKVAPVALNAAYLWSAELLEARGVRAQAADRYRAAQRVYGGDSRMAEVARKALARLK